MTSGKFKTLPITNIVAERGERQRKELTGIDELAESIHRIGLINPIVITADGKLIAGERRLTACRSLGWTAIPVQFVDDLSDYELQSIELEENIKRVDLPWQDQCLALARFHRLKMENEDGWTQEKTGEAIGLSQRTVADQLTVAEGLVSGDERITSAERFSVARNVMQRVNERKRTAAVDSAVANFAVAAKVEVAKEEKPIPLLHGDFHKWQESYDGPKFNLIHCDFPYGINVADSPRQNSVIQTHYEDTPDVYFQLLDRLGLAMDNVVADSAHLIFWFSMKFYTETFGLLSDMGWTVNEFPLIWHKSDNAGVAPDPQRWYRRTYETAFHAARGDRKLTAQGAVANSFSFPGSKSEAFHTSEKPIPVLNHFLRGICDDYSAVLDPTCGSGNAIKAALGLGASSVLGIELGKDFYDDAVARWNEGIQSSTL